MMYLKFNSASGIWYQKFENLMEDPYIRNKYDRNKRINGKYDYIIQHAPEIVKNTGKVICDLGPGFAEFLELVRYFGHNGFGIDAKKDDCEMGDKYMQLSNLLVERQRLNVWYIGFENLLKQDFLPFKDNSIFFINSQGSIEQIFKNFMSGPLHRETMNANLLTWIVDDKLEKIFLKFFQEVGRILENKGILLIYGNGATNVQKYDNLIKRCISKVTALKCIESFDFRFHKIRKEI